MFRARAFLRKLFLVSIFFFLLFFAYSFQSFSEQCPAPRYSVQEDIFTRTTSMCREMFSMYSGDPCLLSYKMPNYPSGFRVGKSIKDGFFLAADNLDSGVLPKTFFDYGLFAPIETAVFDKIIPMISKKAKCQHVVVDVGVNIGYLSFKAASSGYKVFGFEPQTRIHDLLCLSKRINKIKDEQIRIFPFGLSNQSATFNQIITKSWGRAYILEERANKNKKNIEKINVHTLDEILDVDLKIELLKIDVEGHELKVLNGALGLLSKHMVKNIVTELTGENDNISKIWNLLFKQLGYNKVFCWKEVYEDTEAINYSSKGKLVLKEYGAYCETIECVLKNRSTDCWFRLP